MNPIHSSEKNQANGFMEGTVPEHPVGPRPEFTADITPECVYDGHNKRLYLAELAYDIMAVTYFSEVGAWMTSEGSVAIRREALSSAGLKPTGRAYQRISDHEKSVIYYLCTEHGMAAPEGWPEGGFAPYSHTLLIDRVIAGDPTLFRMYFGDLKGSEVAAAEGTGFLDYIRSDRFETLVTGTVASIPVTRLFSRYPACVESHDGQVALTPLGSALANGMVFSSCVRMGTLRDETRGRSMKVVLDSEAVVKMVLSIAPQVCSPSDVVVVGRGYVPGQDQVSGGGAVSGPVTEWELRNGRRLYVVDADPTSLIMSMMAGRFPSASVVSASDVAGRDVCLPSIYGDRWMEAAEIKASIDLYRTIGGCRLTDDVTVPKIVMKLGGNMGVKEAFL